MGYFPPSWPLSSLHALQALQAVKQGYLWCQVELHRKRACTCMTCKGCHGRFHGCLSEGEQMTTGPRIFCDSVNAWNFQGDLLSCKSQYRIIKPGCCVYLGAFITMGRTDTYQKFFMLSCTLRGLGFLYFKFLNGRNRDANISHTQNFTGQLANFKL